MGDANRRLDLVYILTAFAAGTVSVNLQFAWRNDDLAVILLDFRDHIHTGKAGMAPFVGIERGDAHQPVNASFGLAKAVGIFSGDQRRGTFDPSSFAR